MGDILSAKLEGGEDLLKQLKAAGGNVRKSQRAATKAGGEVIRVEAEANAPESRRKKKVIIKASFPQKDVCEVSIQIAKKAWHLKFAETGATAHEVSGNPLVFEGTQGLVITGGVRHPGVPARPFLRPAFDSKSAEAEAAMGEVLRQAVVDARVAQAEAEESDE
ncbi:MAG: HK97 gp10 family phage protein [Chloroflexi bacterium]|nr:HK97 gp10 family phage protein [Chloroflexota bacterium]